MIRELFYLHHAARRIAIVEIIKHLLMSRKFDRTLQINKKLVEILEDPKDVSKGRAQYSKNKRFRRNNEYWDRLRWIAICDCQSKT